MDIISKLSISEQESLKSMLLSSTFVKSLGIEEFISNKNLRMVVYALYMVLFMLFVMGIEKIERNDMYVEIVANQRKVYIIFNTSIVIIVS